MDVITHALIGASVAPNAASAFPIAIGSIIPDLWTVPPMAEYLWRKRGRFHNQEFWATIPSRYGPWMKWSHSSILLLSAALLGIGVFEVPAWFFVGWLLHLLVDIPTHATSRTGFLVYPISEWKPPGWRNWYDIWWMSVAATIVFGAIVYFRFFR
jgi:membrane-bound metal-dependent hydrolase YbcI (DUF457 family)